MMNLVGQEVGHYTLLRLLERGSSDCVYLGEHKQHRSCVAVKVQATNREVLQQARGLSSCWTPLQSLEALVAFDGTEDDDPPGPENSGKHCLQLPLKLPPPPHQNSARNIKNQIRKTQHRRPVGAQTTKRLQRFQNLQQ